MNMFKYNILRSPGPGYNEGGGGLNFTSTSTPANQSNTSLAPEFGTTAATLPGVNITTAYISNPSSAGGG